MESPSVAADLVFVAFNGRVFALDRQSGAIRWRWKGGSLGDYVCLLPDGDTLFVSHRGYTYALDPRTGRQLWYQPFTGEGTGIPSMATMEGASESGGPAAVQAAAAAASAAAAS